MAASSAISLSNDTSSLPRPMPAQKTVALRGLGNAPKSWSAIGNENRFSKLRRLDHGGAGESQAMGGDVQPDRAEEELFEPVPVHVPIRLEQPPFAPQARAQGLDVVREPRCVLRVVRAARMDCTGGGSPRHEFEKEVVAFVICGVAEVEHRLAAGVRREKTIEIVLRALQTQSVEAIGLRQHRRGGQEPFGEGVALAGPALLGEEFAELRRRSFVLGR